MVHDVDEYVVTATGGSGSGVTLSPVMTAMNNQLGKTSYVILSSFIGMVLNILGRMNLRLVEVVVVLIVE